MLQAVLMVMQWDMLALYINSLTPWRFQSKLVSKFEDDFIDW